MIFVIFLSFLKDGFFQILNYLPFIVTFPTYSTYIIHRIETVAK